MTQREQFVADALGEKGKSYASHRDCSGFTAWAARQAGFTLPEGSVAQYREGHGVPVRDMIAGDLVFWDTFGESPGHVALAISPTQVIHALNPDRGIIISDVHANMGGPMVGVRRLTLKGDDAGSTPDPKDENAGGTVPITFGNVKHPAYERKIVDKPWEGAGFDRVAPRKILGVCDHQWWGYGDKYSLVRLFGSGGERQGDALTDYSITFEGELVMLNDPIGTRSPWANGPTNDLDGDGALFVRKIGIAQANARLVSLESEGKGEAMTEAMLDVASSLHAYWFDQAKVPYTEYPNNPNVGCVTHLQHWEFGPKECPFGGIRGQTSEFQDRIRGKLKAAQTGGAPAPVPPVNPPEPNHDWLPDNLTVPVVESLFGSGVRHNIDGSTTPVAFDAKGVISNAWLHRGAKEGVYPAFDDWWVVPGSEGRQRSIVSFINGWVLLGSDDTRVSWKWLGA